MSHVFNLFRDLLAFIFIPVIEKEMNTFRETVWNSHRVRCQKEAQMPKGVPDHVYSFPEVYEAEQCGKDIMALYVISFCYNYGVIFIVFKRFMFKVAQ